MPSIGYRTTNVKDIELIHPLWIQLNEYHHLKAKVFQILYQQMTMDDRKAYFEKVAVAGSLRLDLAFDPQAGGRYVGYCVSSLSLEKTGEIESIYVKEEYRSRGIGSALVIRALAWLDENDTVRNRVSVSDGNKGAWDFYKKLLSEYWKLLIFKNPKPVYTLSD